MVGPVTSWRENKPLSGGGTSQYSNTGQVNHSVTDTNLVMGWIDFFINPRNDIGAVSVKAGCTFTGFVTTDFTGVQCVLRKSVSEYQII